MLLVVLFVVKLTDPLGIILALAGAMLARRWLHVAIVAAAVAIMQEILLHAFQYTRVFSPVMLLIGIAAAACWAAAGFWTKAKWKAGRRFISKAD